MTKTTFIITQDEYDLTKEFMDWCYDMPLYQGYHWDSMTGCAFAQFIKHKHKKTVTVSANVYKVTGEIPTLIPLTIRVALGDENKTFGELAQQLSYCLEKSRVVHA